jgi:thiol-disulfide isomerase/thioredoxin
VTFSLLRTFAGHRLVSVTSRCIRNTSKVYCTLPHADDLKFLKGDPCTVPTPSQVTVVELWAKWCGPCRQVFPHLTAIFKARKDQGLSVVGISVEDDPTLPDFVRGEGNRMAYTVAVSTAGSAARLMERARVSGIPHAFVVDRGGLIVYRYHSDLCTLTAAYWKNVCTISTTTASTVKNTHNITGTYWHGIMSHHVKTCHLY